MSSRWQESSINTLKMVITFTQMKNPGPKCIWKEIPKEKPSGPFGETNILPGCGSPAGNHGQKSSRRMPPPKLLQPMIPPIKIVQGRK